MRVTRREFGIAITVGAMAACSDSSTPTTPTKTNNPGPAPSPGPSPQPQRTVASVLGNTVTWQCHNRFGQGIIAKQGEGQGGYVVTINGTRFTALEVGENGRIDLYGWPVGANDRVEAVRLTNTPVVNQTNRC